MLVAHAAAHRRLQLAHEPVADLVVATIVLGESLGLDVRPRHDARARGVDGGRHRDEPFLTKDLAIGEGVGGELAHPGSLDEDVGGIHLADDAGPAVVQVDDTPIGDDDGVLGLHTGGHRDTGVRHEVPVLAVDRHDGTRSHDIVGVEQLTLGGMPGDVNQRIALVHHGGTAAHEAVDDAGDGVLVAGDERARHEHDVALPHRDVPVLTVGDASQGRQRLTLGTGADDGDLVVGVLVEVAQLDERVVGHLEVAQIAGDRHVAHHGTSDVADLAPVPHGGVDRLLDAVDVRGEGGDDELLGGLVEGLLDGRGEVALGTHESGHLGVRGVDHEDVDTLLTEPGKGPQVGDPPVDGQLVHLEVAGVEDRTGVGLDVDGQRVGDGVVDGDELDVELLADLGGAALTHHAQVVVADAVLLELGLH